MRLVDLYAFSMSQWPKLNYSSVNYSTFQTSKMCFGGAVDNVVGWHTCSRGLNFSLDKSHNLYIIYIHVML